jgi:hypothetical protein
MGEPAVLEESEQEVFNVYRDTNQCIPGTGAWSCLIGGPCPWALSLHFALTSGWPKRRHHKLYE